MDGPGFDSLTRSLALGRSRRSVLRGLAGGGAALFAAKAGATLAAPGGKAEICHSVGNGRFQSISVSVNALPAHMAHGDGCLGTNEHCSACGDACASDYVCSDRTCVPVDPNHGAGGS